MILLVEDEAVTRTEFAGNLRAYGYDVIEAVDGAEAIALLEKQSDEIKLIITDMVLPKVNGLHLIREVQQRWPHVPVIMISAYLSQQSGKTILGEHVDVLQKPVRPSLLLLLVQRILPHPLDS